MDSGIARKNGATPAFCPLPIQLTGANSQAASSNICVEIQRPLGTIKMKWPTESAAACATFLRVDCPRHRRHLQTNLLKDPELTFKSIPRTTPTSCSM